MNKTLLACSLIVGLSFSSATLANSSLGPECDHPKVKEALVDLLQRSQSWYVAYRGFYPQIAISMHQQVGTIPEFGIRQCGAAVQFRAEGNNRIPRTDVYYQVNWVNPGANDGNFKTQITGHKEIRR